MSEKPANKLPRGWYEAFDPNTQMPYYYNERGQTQWEFPEEEAYSESDNKLLENERSEQRKVPSVPKPAEDKNKKEPEKQKIISKPQPQKAVSKERVEPKPEQKQTKADKKKKQKDDTTGKKTIPEQKKEEKVKPSKVQTPAPGKVQTPSPSKIGRQSPKRSASPIKEPTPLQPKEVQKQKSGNQAKKGDDQDTIKHKDSVVKYREATPKLQDNVVKHREATPKLPDSNAQRRSTLPQLTQKPSPLVPQDKKQGLKKDATKNEVQKRDTSQKRVSGKGTNTPKPQAEKYKDEDIMVELSQCDKEKIASGVEYSLLHNAINLILTPFQDGITLCALIIPQFVWLILELVVGCVFLSGYVTTDNSGSLKSGAYQYIQIYLIIDSIFWLVDIILSNLFLFFPARKMKKNLQNQYNITASQQDSRQKYQLSISDRQFDDSFPNSRVKYKNRRNEQGVAHDINRLISSIVSLLNNDKVLKRLAFCGIIIYVIFRIIFIILLIIGTVFVAITQPLYYVNDDSSPSKQLLPHFIAMITIAGGWFALAVRIVLFLSPLVFRYQILKTNEWISNFNYKTLLEKKYAPAAVAGSYGNANRRFTEYDNLSNSGHRKENRQVIYQNRASEDGDSIISDGADDR